MKAYKDRYISKDPDETFKMWVNKPVFSKELQKWVEKVGDEYEDPTHPPVLINSNMTEAEANSFTGNGFNKIPFVFPEMQFVKMKFGIIPTYVFVSNGLEYFSNVDPESPDFKIEKNAVTLPEFLKNKFLI